MLSAIFRWVYAGGAGSLWVVPALLRRCCLLSGVRGREVVFRYTKRALSGFLIANAAQHKRHTAGASTQARAVRSPALSGEVLSN